MSLNGISELATKELRQKAKLDLAAANRAADGNARPYYDLAQLPTLYDDNAVVDNENAGGLVVGRPWVSTTYTLTADASVDEGSGILFVASGTNVPNGVYYWTIETNSGDFTVTSGSIGVENNYGSFYVGPDADATTEGSETFTVALRSGSTSGPILVISDPVTINDTSLTSTPFIFTEVINTQGETITETNVGPLTIEARATSYQVFPPVDGYISVNGTTIKTTTDGSRGHTLAVISPTGATVGTIDTFDTFESAPSDAGAAGRTALTSALNAVASGNYIVLVSWDACSWDAGLRTALNTGYGITLTTTWASTRYSHIVIAKKI